MPALRRSSVRRSVVLLAVVAAGALAPAQASGPPPADDSEPGAACRAALGDSRQGGGGVCRVLEFALWNAADACRSAPVGSPESCAVVDGRVVGESEMAAYESSWVHRALTRQRSFDDSVPLLRTLWPHTHNSFNSFAYDPTLSGLDPNQVYSIRDQLRMDIRAIEMDVHWVPSIHGSAATGGRAVVLCHGRTEATPAGPLHIGCSNDPPFAAGLDELRSWLDEPANRAEVVLLYLQNELDGDLAAHQAAVAAIAGRLGDLVYRPPAGSPCAPLPLSATKASVRATGARVVLVGDCGPGGWGTWVHQRGPHWNEAGSGPGDDYALGGCAAERAGVGYDTRFVRRYEDVTGVSYAVNGGAEVTVAETARMVRCGVNLVGFDFLVPADPRLEALVWSWAPGEPVAAGCAASRGDGRFTSRSCADPLPAVCRTATGAWRVTTGATEWSGAAGRCELEHAGATFAVPANGYENTLVVAAKAAAGAAEAWVATTA